MLLVRRQENTDETLWYSYPRMISLGLAIVFYGTLLWLVIHRPYLVCFLFLLLFAWAWRFASVLYIDEAGPLFSYEMGRDIGGGHSAAVLLLAYLIVIATFLVVHRPSRLRELAAIRPPDAQSATARRNLRVVDVVFAGYIAFVILLFLDMARTGVVPLFDGIERWTYTREIAGPVHGWLTYQGNLICFYLGIFFAARAHRTGQPDNRFLFILLTIFLYLFLAGNRFSAFYANTSFFLLPWGAVNLRQRFGTAVPPPPSSPGRRLRNRILQVTSVVALVSMISFAVYRSYTITRGYGDVAKIAVEHRVLVQQGELFWTTFERVFRQGRFDSANAFDKVFIHNLDPGKNSSLPLLMYLELGDAAFDNLEAGSQFSGGYPEAVFELLGPWLGFGGILLMAIVLARLARLVLWAMLSERYLTLFFAYFVMYAFYLFHVSAMLNFVLNWKYGLKVAALTSWLLFEATRAAASKSRREAAISG